MANNSNTIPPNLQLFDLKQYNSLINQLEAQLARLKLQAAVENDNANNNTEKNDSDDSNNAILIENQQLREECNRIKSSIAEAINKLKQSCDDLTSQHISTATNRLFDRLIACQLIISNIHKTRTHTTHTAEEQNNNLHNNPIKSDEKKVNIIRSSSNDNCPANYGVYEFRTNLGREEFITQFPDKIEFLKALGYSDVLLLEKILRNTKGDINKCVDFLMDIFPLKL
jgi:uncharacterized membrane-anchored protein YhcB (DUF1043 family)